MSLNQSWKANISGQGKNGPFEVDCSSGFAVLKGKKEWPAPTEVCMMPAEKMPPKPPKPPSPSPSPAPAPSPAPSPTTTTTTTTTTKAPVICGCIYYNKVGQSEYDAIMAWQKTLSSVTGYVVSVLQQSSYSSNLYTCWHAYETTAQRDALLSYYKKILNQSDAWKSSSVNIHYATQAQQDELFKTFIKQPDETFNNKCVFYTASVSSLPSPVWKFKGSNYK